MLEHIGEVYLDDRTDLLDGDPDELWSDKTITRYLNQAQRIHARRTWCITEYGTAPAGLITLVTGKLLYPYHKSVLRVYDATPAGQTSPLGRGRDSQLRNPQPPADAFDIGEANALAGGTALQSPGAPLAFASDAATRTIRVFPAPAAAQNGLQLSLKITRMPIKWLDTAKPDECPEIPEEYHMDLCDYAAARCLMQPNVDSQSKVDGRDLLKTFDDAVKEARRDRQRAERTSDSRWGFNSTTAVIR